VPVLAREELRRRTHDRPRRSIFRRRRPSLGVVAGLSAFLLSAGQLLVWRPPIGLADNGDYGRLLCQLGQKAVLPAGVPAYFRWVNFRYQQSPQGHCLSYYSTELPVLRAAQWVSKHLFHFTGLDLQVVGLIHAAILAILVWLVVRVLPGPRWVRVVAAIVLLIGICDTSFVVYLSSAYSEPMSMMGVLALLAAGLHTWRYSVVSTVGLLCIFGAALLLILAKTQNAPLAVVVLLALVARRCPLGRWRGTITARFLPVILGLILVLVAANYSASAPRTLRQNNKYDAVFFELLNNSSNPAQDALALGLDPSLARYAGTSAYSRPNASSDPAFAEFDHVVSYWKLAQFYAARPGRMLDLAARGAHASLSMRPKYLGSYAASSGYRGQACRLCLVSSAASALQPVAPVLVPVLWLGSIVTAVALRRRRAGPGETRALADALILLPTLAIGAFAAALLGEGGYEMVKHMFLVAVTDVVLLPMVGVGVAILLGDRRRIPPVIPPLPRFGHSPISPMSSARGRAPH